MRITILAADFPPSHGGIQAYVSSLAAAATQQGADIRVIALQQPQAQQWDASAPYEVQRVQAASKLQIWRRMRDAAIGGDSDVIIAGKWFPEGPAALQAARASDCPCVVMGYDREFALHGLNLVKWGMQKWVLGACDLCAVCSNYAADMMESMGVRRQKIHCISGGVDTDMFSPDPQGAQQLRGMLALDNEPVCVSVARLVPHKGHRYVLEAVSAVRSEIPDLKYVIVGEGNYRDCLQQQVSALDLNESVIFTGRVDYDRLPAYYTVADVAVMPSYDIPGEPTEGFGLSYLEANACGTPVIGAMTGGVPEVIDHDISGLLVPQKDTEALTRALLRLLGDRDYAQKLGQQGMERVHREFTWDLVARRLVTAVKSLHTAP
ncbi:MAG: glycosyltransferase family 4 protein [Armatimonadota bacterium]